ADGGSRGDVLVTTSDGRLLISQSNQVDILNPATAPLVVATNPPSGSVVALPLGQMTVTFDQDMFVGQGTESGSVINLATYRLLGSSGPVPFSQVFYVAASHTVFLTFPALQADSYTLTVFHDVTSIQGTAMLQDYTAA